LENLAVSAPIGANRAFSEFRKFFNWTVEEDILPLSPIAGKKKLTSEKGRERDRTLLRVDDVPGSSDDELRWLWKAAASYDRGEATDLLNGKKLRGPFGPLTQLLILTGQRRSEVAGMTWGEIDLVERIWTIPGNRTKNKQPHMVPLSDAAMEIIEGLPRIAGKPGYVFTTNGRTPVSGYDRMKKRLDRLMAEVAADERGEALTIPRWTLHDIRRTVAAGLQRLGVKLEVTEKALNHTSGSFAGIVKVYQVYGYAEEKRAALQAWGRFVTDLVEGRAANVIPLRA
jgi:integrase